MAADLLPNITVQVFTGRINPRLNGGITDLPPKIDDFSHLPSVQKGLKLSNEHELLAHDFFPPVRHPKIFSAGDISSDARSILLCCFQKISGKINCSF